jgi:alpha-galactosidase
MSEKNTTRRTFVGLAAAACGALVAPHKARADSLDPTGQTTGSASYLDILRLPDLLIAYSGLETRMPLSRSGDHWGSRDIQVQTAVTPGTASTELPIHLSSPHTALTHLHLRWNFKVAAGLRVLGDAWERSYGDLEWRGFVPERPMPWYFLTFGGNRLNGYGVRTGARSLCFWQIDPGGVSLWTDLRNGGNPVELGARELHAATVVARAGEEGEAPNESARLFCRTMCPEPRLPDGPLYGSNDWNYAYGKNTADGVLRDADLVASLAPRSAHRPLVVIDDGWQDKLRFPDMAGLATAIRDRQLRPGIWIRPTRATQEAKPSLLLSPARFAQGSTRSDLTYDPTIPEALEAILDAIRLPVSWGYEFLKHDFSTYELFGQWGSEMGPSPTRDGWSFADRSRTNAEILLSFYQALRRTAGDKVLLLGCNTVGHLSAGIFESQRIGDDTSGRSWERTRRMGVNTLAFRNPQHRTLFHIDPDCVAITTRTQWSDSRQWLHLVSHSGASLFVAPQPEAVGPEQRAAMKDAFQLVASSTGFAEDWLDDTTPQHWRFRSSEESRESYQWSGSEGVPAFRI